MARPIIPVSVRRLGDAQPVEVLTRSGYWTLFDNLAPASQVAVRTKWYEDGGTGGWPDGQFHHEFGTDMAERADEDLLPPVVQSPSDSSDSDESTEAEADDSDDESDDNDGETDSQQQQQRPQPSSSDLTIEAIIRRIAGEMDNAVVDQLSTEWEQALTEALEKFSEKTDDDQQRLVPIISRVEIVRNDVVMPEDGIFHNQFPKLLRAVGAGQHCYLPGPPGSGKSHSCEQVATVIGWRFASISLGPTTPESRLWGGMTADGEFFEPPFVQLARYAMDNPESGAVFCLDEMDNGHAGIIATLNSALANGWFNAPNGDRVTMGKNFVIVAAANTFGTGPTARFAGRNKLDAATLDRFAYLPWDTDTAVETVMVKSILHGDNADMADQWLDVWRTLRQNVTHHGIEFFITMRGALNGARLIAAGFTLSEALDMVIGSKVPSDQWVRVNPL